MQEAVHNRVGGRILVGRNHPAEDTWAGRSRAEAHIRPEGDIPLAEGIRVGERTRVVEDNLCLDHTWSENDTKPQSFLADVRISFGEKRTTLLRFGPRDADHTMRSPDSTTESTMK